MLGLLTLVAGGAKFVWFSTFVNVASKRSFTFSRIAIDFARPVLTATVPGASRLPTRAFPMRAAPAGVGANALMLKYWLDDR